MKKSKYVNLAEKVIHDYIKTKQIPKNKFENDSDFQKQKACFVSIHKNNNQLRGCIGTIYPYRKTLYEEIIHNAIAASTEDPRFLPVSENELDDLIINVDILSEPQLIKNINELDCKKYGVIVSDGYRKGVLLPDLEGVDSVEYQLQIAKNKAGIRTENKNIEIYKFTVERYY